MLLLNYPLPSVFSSSLSVSILVLVDVALERIDYSVPIDFLDGFNPCSRGCCS